MSMGKTGRKMTLKDFKNNIDRNKKYVTVGDRAYLKKHGHYRWSEIEKRISQDYDYVQRVEGTSGKELAIILGSKIKQKSLVKLSGTGIHNVKEFQNEATALLWNYMIGRTERKEFKVKEYQEYSDWQMTAKRWLIAADILPSSMRDDGKYNYVKNMYYYNKFKNNVYRENIKQDAMKCCYWEVKERHYNDLFKSVKRKLEKHITFKEVHVGSVPSYKSLLKLWLRAFMITFYFEDVDYDIEKFDVNVLCNKILLNWEELSVEKIEQFLELTDIDYEKLTHEELKFQIVNFCSQKKWELDMAIDEEKNQGESGQYNRKELTYDQKKEIDELKDKLKIDDNPTIDWKLKLLLYERYDVILVWVEYEINLNQVIQHKNKYYYNFNGKEIKFPLDNEQSSLLLEKFQLAWFEDFHFRTINRVIEHISDCASSYLERDRLVPDFAHNLIAYQLRKSGQEISYFWKQDLAYWAFYRFIDKIDSQKITDYYTTKLSHFKENEFVEIIILNGDLDNYFRELHFESNFDFTVKTIKNKEMVSL